MQSWKETHGAARQAAAVAEIVESFNDSAGAVLTEYRGLTVKQLQDLRRCLGENANYAVVKNTLTKIAAKEAGVEGFDDLLTGPTAIAFINGDVVEAAKGLRDFAKANPALVIKGGYLDGSLDRRQGDRQAGRPRVARGAPGQAGRRDAGLAEPGRLPAQRPARPGRPARRCAPGEGRAGPVDPRGGGAGEPAAAAEEPTPTEDAAADAEPEATAEAAAAEDATEEAPAETAETTEDSTPNSGEA